MGLGIALLTLLVAWATAARMLDAYGQRDPPKGNFDAIVVPGCAVRSDGRASGALQRRTEHAIKLWHAGRAPTIVLTGGIGRHPPSEAHVAAKIAEHAGVPKDALLLENASTTTEENARFSVKLHHEMSEWSIIVVSDAYHCWRCKQLFSRHYAHVSAAGSIPPPSLRVRGALREVVSIGKMWANSIG